MPFLYYVNSKFISMNFPFLIIEDRENESFSIISFKSSNFLVRKMTSVYLVTTIRHHMGFCNALKVFQSNVFKFSGHLKKYGWNSKVHSPYFFVEVLIRLSFIKKLGNISHIFRLDFPSFWLIKVLFSYWNVLINTDEVL